MVSAPASYRAEEFIAHLFAALCVVVIGEDPDEDRRPRGWVRRAILAVLALAGAGFVVRWPPFGLAHASTRDGVAIVLWMLSGLVLGGMLVFAVVARAWLAPVARPENVSPRASKRRRARLDAALARWRAHRYDGRLVARARCHLHDLRNLDTVSRAMSGELGPLNAAWEGCRQGRVDGSLSALCRAVLLR